MLFRFTSVGGVRLDSFGNLEMVFPFLAGEIFSYCGVISQGNVLAPWLPKCHAFYVEADIAIWNNVLRELRREMVLPRAPLLFWKCQEICFLPALIQLVNLTSPPLR